MIRIQGDSAQKSSFAEFKAATRGLLVRRPIPESVLNAHGFSNAEVDVPAPGPDYVRDGYEMIEGTWQTKWREKSAQEVADELQAWRERAVVNMNQARKALHAAGLLASVPSALASLPEEARVPAEIDWEYSATVRRLSPLVTGLAPALDLTDEQVDQLFRDAAAL